MDRKRFSLIVTNYTQDFTKTIYSDYFVIGSSGTLTIVNPASGRKASINIYTNADNTVRSVEAVGQPYFCFNPAAAMRSLQPIPSGPDAGKLTPNCSSPIYFDGAITGAIQNIRTIAPCS